MLFCQGNIMEISGDFERTQMWQPCLFTSASEPVFTRQASSHTYLLLPLNPGIRW